MADNVAYTPGSGATIAADEVGGALHQRVKISIGADGAAADLAPGQALMAASLPVVLASNHSDVKITLDSEAVVLGAGSAAIGKLAANSGVDIGDVDVTSLPASTNTIEVVGDVAHDAAAAGNPLRIGGFAVNALPAAVANNDAANIITDLFGRLIVVPLAPPEKWEAYTSPSDITDTADDAAFSAAGAGVKHYITRFSAMCSHATTGTWVYLKDGSTVIASIYAAAAGGGAVLTFDPPLIGTANTAVNVANATTSSATRVNVSGYQGA